MNERRDVSVYLAHLKPYHPRETPPTSQVHKLAECLLGNQICLPALDHPNEAQPRIESYIYVVDKVVAHKLVSGRKSLHNFDYCLRLRGYVPESDLGYRADEVAQCHALIAAYKIVPGHGLHIASPENAKSRDV